MAVLPIYEFPHQVLRKKAKKVRKIGKVVERLADDMIDTLHAANGVGLAANQVGALQRVIVIHLPEEEEPRVYINPEIVHKEGEREVEEGCLSIPGYRGMVKRSEKVRARALGLDGKVIRITAEGLLAQALEHETGHLNGSLYIDHLVSPDQLWKITYLPDEADGEETTGADTAGKDTGPVTEPSSEDEIPTG